MSAAAPATCGLAIEVPEIDWVALSLPMLAPRMLTPGAKMSTQEPKFENEARLSASSLAATVMADGSLAGDVLHASWLSLPAASANGMPDATALATASLSACEKPPPRLMLATQVKPLAAQSAATKSMPPTTLSIEPEPPQSRTRAACRVTA